MGGLALAYFVAGKAGLRLAFLQPSASPVWPPAGIAVAALLVLGSRAWPAVFRRRFSCQCDDGRERRHVARDRERQHARGALRSLALESLCRRHPGV